MSVTSYTRAKIDELLLALSTTLSGKADSAALVDGLAGKVNSSTFTTGLAAKADAEATATALASKADAAATSSALAGKASTASLATVATTGAYADLTGQPTIPAPTTDAGALSAGTLPEARLPSRLADASLRAALVPRPTGGSDGQALVKSGTDVAWGAAGLTATQIATDPTVKAAAIASVADQMLPGKACLTHGDHLGRWRQKLAASQYRTANVLMIGCSPFLGQYSQDVSGTDHVAWRARGQVASLRGLFARTYGTVGEGVIVSSDPRITVSGASTVGSIGISQAGGRRLTATGHSVTLTLTADSIASEVWVHGWWESNAKCTTPLVSVDGGAATAMAGITALGTDVDYTYKITGLTAGVHTVVVTASTTTQIDVAGFSIWNPSNGQAAGNGGVGVHRVALGGGYIDTAVYATSNAGANPRSNRLTLGRPQTDLLILGFGINEASVVGQAATWSPTGQAAKNYQTALTDFVTYATDVYGCDVLLASLQHWDPAQVGVYGEQPFRDVHEQIAASNPHVAHFDLAKVAPWTSFATATAQGLYVDTIHTKAIGHADTARLIHQAIQ